DLGLADPGRADHQDVLGVDLVAQIAGHVLAAPAVPQGDRDRPLRGVLADDVAVELGDHLARREAPHSSSSSTVIWSLVYRQISEAMRRLRSAISRADS